ncbi:hypothetical protein [Streptomyces mirabilis]
MSRSQRRSLAQAAIAACARETEVDAPTAAGSWIPTNMNSALLSR